MVEEGGRGREIGGACLDFGVDVRREDESEVKEQTHAYK